jgi:hypothetical protein
MYTQKQLLTIYKLLRATNNVGNLTAETEYSRQHIYDVFHTYGVADKHPDIVKGAIKLIKDSNVLDDIVSLTELLNK